ncbi:hypothetical protein [Bifidobacterium vansinderenii]|uniref:Uncharacterized protein n=1 Tax=Bifidobacterium vansinderenii TaxID=1984871 RepID=A0A229W0W4_9BIFI|nr:hypothetical protein [Bifidobacterium vansinderenii]OXN01466.1 hypothetical protein Tam10B_0469 [Bifidobacterium vansinderenii]
MTNITQRDRAYRHVIDQVNAMIEDSAEHVEDPRARVGYRRMGHEIIRVLEEEMRPPASMRKPR